MLAKQDNNEIKSLIYEIRGKQVMLDSDVALLYGIETRTLNQTVKRNINRFPKDFCFILTKEEYRNLRSHFVISSLKIDNYGGRRYLPYVFTEKGIIMISALLKSEIAISMSIKIVEAFVEMRKFINNNKNLFDRVIGIENTISTKFLEYDRKFDELFDYFQEEKEFSQKIFFNGQIYDSYSLIIDIIKSAKKEIIIIDNYIDKTVLDILSKKNNNVTVRVIGNQTSKLSNLDISKFNSQYPKLIMIYSDIYHDRFIIIDNDIIYHCGASLKDLGKKVFAINKMEDRTLLEKIFVNN